jgi:ERCC4-related helicase
MNSARHYQKELAETAYSRNSIVVLDTGLGKTLIAVLVANRFLAEQSDKKVLFLAPTSPLVQQQGLYLKHVLMKSVFAIYGGTLDDAVLR